MVRLRVAQPSEVVAQRGGAPVLGGGERPSMLPIVDTTAPSVSDMYGLHGHCAGSGRSP